MSAGCEPAQTDPIRTLGSAVPRMSLSEGSIPNIIGDAANRQIGAIIPEMIRPSQPPRADAEESEVARLKGERREEGRGQRGTVVVG